MGVDPAHVPAHGCASATAVPCALFSSHSRRHAHHPCACCSEQILEEDEELFFHLQQQRLIELIRSGDVDASLEFAQECLAPLGEDRPTFLEEVERTVALLLFEDARAAPRAELLEPAQRQKTASRLNAAVLRSQSQVRVTHPV